VWRKVNAAPLSKPKVGISAPQSDKPKSLEDQRTARTLPQSSERDTVMLQNILWIVAILVIIGAVFSLFRGLVKWGIILLIVALLFGGFGFFA